MANESVSDRRKSAAEAAGTRAKERAAEANLSILGVEEGRVWVSCRECGHRWSPKLTAGGRLPLGWWKCPKGCNHK